MGLLQSLIGLLAFAGLAWLISENKKRVRIRGIVVGLVIQLVVGVILLKLPFFRDFFIALNRMVLSLEESTRAGTAMVFGYLGGGLLFLVGRDEAVGRCGPFVTGVRRVGGRAAFIEHANGPLVIPGPRSVEIPRPFARFLLFSRDNREG